MRLRPALAWTLPFLTCLFLVSTAAAVTPPST